jgi:integrase
VQVDFVAGRCLVLAGPAGVGKSFAAVAALREVRNDCASLQEVKDLLGHHSLAMILRYGHLAPEHLRTAVSRLDAALPVSTAISAQGSTQEDATEGVLLAQ